VIDVPFDQIIWDAGQVAEYLKMSRGEFLRSTRYDKGFPAPLPMSAGGRPKWRAVAVTGWAVK